MLGKPYIHPLLINVELQIYYPISTFRAVLTPRISWIKRIKPLYPFFRPPCSPLVFQF